LKIAIAINPAMNSSNVFGSGALVAGPTGVGAARPSAAGVTILSCVPYHDGESSDHSALARQAITQIEQNAVAPISRMNIEVRAIVEFATLKPRRIHRGSVLGTN